MDNMEKSAATPFLPTAFYVISTPRPLHVQHGQVSEYLKKSNVLKYLRYCELTHGC